MSNKEYMRLVSRYDFLYRHFLDADGSDPDLKEIKEELINLEKEMDRLEKKGAC